MSPRKLVKGFKSYLKGSPGTRFIFYFEILIISCIYLLIQRTPEAQSLAEKLAIYAYYTLTIGVILQFIHFLLKKE